ncbi:MAG: molybdopterin-binding protein [Myxococcota bacterium]
MSCANAAIILIGDEILSGKVNDENGPYLIRALRERGIDLLEIRVIGDQVEAIQDAVNELRHRVKHLFTTGGIGPTHDDVTIGGIAAALQRKVVHDPRLLARLNAIYGENLSEAHLKLAEVPDGATLYFGNERFLTTICVDNIVILPGVPSLMRICFQRIAESLQGDPVMSQVLLLNTSETKIAASLDEVQKAMPEVSIGSYPRFDEADYRVKVTVDGRDAKQVQAAIAAIKAKLDTAWIIS